MKTNIFIKREIKNTLTMLRAPYKNKLGRHQLGLSRYNINCSFLVKLNKELIFKNISFYFFFLKITKHFFLFFESNICYQHSTVFFIQFKYKKFFIYTC